MEVELQKQDFKAIENMETSLRLQKNEVCVHSLLSQYVKQVILIHHLCCKTDSSNDMTAGKSITFTTFCYSYVHVWNCTVKLLQPPS